MLADGNSIPTSEYVNLVLAIVGAFCAIVVAIVGFIVRSEVKRVYALLHDIESNLCEECNKRSRLEAWLRAVLARAGLITVPDEP